MKETLSRPERYLNTFITFDAKKKSELASIGRWDNAYVDDAIHADKLANNPDLSQSIEECQDVGIERTGTLFLLEAKNPEREYEEMYAQDKHFPDNPVGDLPV